MPRIIILFFFLAILSACNNKPTETHSAIPMVEKKPASLIAAADKLAAQQESSDLKYIMGKFIPEEDHYFVRISEDYADRTGMYLRKEAYQSFLRMYEAAKLAGIELQIRSATRNFDYQKGIWERKWTGETILSTGENAATAFPESKDRALKILNYSSMPGTSRHHWGTDIDLNKFNNEWFETGEGLQLFEWLEAHAHEYGFCRPYTAKGPNRPEGYNEEKWHWSYTPLSDELTNLAETYLKENMITGFMGSEVAEELEVVKNYVLGINHSCRAH